MSDMISEKKQFSQAILDLKFKSVLKLLANLPPDTVTMDPETDLDEQQFQKNHQILGFALGEALNNLPEQKKFKKKHLKIPLYLFWFTLLEYPLLIQGIIEKGTKSSTLKNRQIFLLSYDCIPLEITGQFKFFDRIMCSMFTFHKSFLKEKDDYLKEFSLLIKGFRGTGWERSLILEDTSDQGLEQLKQYLKQISPEIAKSVEALPPKTLNTVLTQIILGFKSGKAEDDTYLEQGDKLASALTEYFPQPTAHITCEYVGFFGHRTEKTWKGQKIQACLERYTSIGKKNDLVKHDVVKNDLVKHDVVKNDVVKHVCEYAGFFEHPKVISRAQPTHFDKRDYLTDHCTIS